MRNLSIGLLIAGVLCGLAAIAMAGLAYSGVAGGATNIVWILFVLLLLGGGMLGLVALVLYLVTLRARRAASTSA